MATQTLTAAAFEQTVLDNDIVLVDFWALRPNSHWRAQHASRPSPR
jgi:hypothetical protein